MTTMASRGGTEAVGGVGEAERKRLTAKATRAFWGNLWPAEPSAEMQRRTVKRKLRRSEKLTSGVGAGGGQVFGPVTRGTGFQQLEKQMRQLRWHVLRSKLSVNSSA
jgi:hypothetical protein